MVLIAWQAISVVAKVSKLNGFLPPTFFRRRCQKANTAKRNNTQTQGKCNDSSSATYVLRGFASYLCDHHGAHRKTQTTAAVHSSSTGISKLCCVEHTSVFTLLFFHELLVHFRSRKRRHVGCWAGRYLLFSRVTRFNIDKSQGGKREEGLPLEWNKNSHQPLQECNGVLLRYRSVTRSS